MGKGTITSHLGDGRYSVRVRYDRTKTDAEIARLATDIAELTTAIAAKAAEQVSAQLDVEFVEQALSAAIAGGDQKAIGDAEQSLREAMIVLQAANEVLSWLRLKKTAAEKRKAFLEQKVPDDMTLNAWCADYNLELSGDVGLIEPGRQAVAAPVIRPAGSDGTGAAYNAAQDGQLQPLLVSTAHGAFYNQALLPGMAKWKPRYRSGLISNLDGDTCDVALDALTGLQGIDLNQAASLAGVPIAYMECNGGAFQDGDHVIVEFTGMDFSAPKVVGFVDHPRRCIMPNYLFVPVMPSSDTRGPSSGYPFWYDAPFDAGLGIVDWTDPYNPGSSSATYDPVYNCGPGVIIDLDTGQRVPLINPDTNNEITETIRGDDTNGYITWQGVYPSIIEQIIGYPFVGSQSSAMVRGGAINGQDKAIWALSSVSIGTTVDFSNGTDTFPQESAEPIFPNLGGNLINLPPYVHEILDYNMGGTIEDNDQNFYGQIPEFVSEKTFDWLGETQSSNNYQRAGTGSINYQYRYHHDWSQPDGGPDAEYSFSGYSDDVNRIDLTMQLPSGDSLRAQSAIRFDLSQGLEAYGRDAQLNFSAQTSNLAEKNLSAMTLYGTDREVIALTPAIYATTHAGRIFSAEYIVGRRYQKENPSPALETVSALLLRYKVGCPMKAGGTMYATSDYDYTTPPWKSFDETQLAAVIGTDPDLSALRDVMISTLR